MTAWTPGICAAAATSMPVIRALACGLRTVAPKSMPSRCKSLAYSNSPLTFGRPSIRGTDWPTPALRPTPMLIRNSMPSCPDQARFADVHEMPVVNHELPLDEEVVNRSGIAKNQRGDRITLRAAECQAVDGEERDVRALADLERPDVIAPEASGAASGRQPQRVARRHGRGTSARAGRQKRLAGFTQQVPAVVRGRAVDREPDRDAGVEELTPGSKAGTQAHIRRWAPGHTGFGLREARDVRRAQMHAMCQPDVRTEKAEIVKEFHRATPERFLTIFFFVQGLGNVRVQPHAVAPRQRGRLTHQFRRDGKR